MLQSSAGRRRGVPGSFGIGISDDTVYIGRWDEDVKRVTTVIIPRATTSARPGATPTFQRERIGRPVHSGGSSPQGDNYGSAGPSVEAASRPERRGASADVEDDDPPLAGLADERGSAPRPRAGSLGWHGRLSASNERTSSKGRFKVDCEEHGSRLEPER